ncbi:MAG: cytochrome c biogenesis protein CcdA [Sphingomonadales bacterium]|nr:cytochrome c biogenesis protein CcdA [Sphingomonadales bacterium]MBU3991669.1 cytochrome c biogenesis CcdA family protein [Alphaproteobacteria bacterium]
MSGALNPALAYAAGVLTILSPCVLPLVPIVLANAAQGKRHGPLALCLGLVASFTVTGMALATAGNGLLADPENLRIGGALLMGLVALVLISKQAQLAVAGIAAPLANWAQARQAGLERFGLLGQFAIGVLLGLIWIPCVGPTLGAAVVLAAQGERLGSVALIMAAYAAGIASLLLLIGVTAQSILKRTRTVALEHAERAKRALGWTLAAIAILVLTGLDHLIEGAVLSVMPDWVVDLTTAL